MSAEGKKKRGESGQTNAKMQAFRLGGKHCDLSTRIGATIHPRLAGARMLHALDLAYFVLKFEPSDRLLRAADEVIEHIARRGYKIVRS